MGAIAPGRSSRPRLRKFVASPPHVSGPTQDYCRTGSATANEAVGLAGPHRDGPNALAQRRMYGVQPIDVTQAEEAMWQVAFTPVGYWQVLKGFARGQALPRSSPWYSLCKVCLTESTDDGADAAAGVDDASATPHEGV